MSEQYENDATILVVDDDETTRLLLEVMLQDVGYTVYPVKNGADALHKLEQISPHLILSDVNMPGMNGMELLKTIRERPDTSATPVILLTARDGDENVIKGLDLGADDYLIKPVDTSVLRARIRAKLKRPPTPITELVRDYRTRLMTFPSFMSELERELLRIRHWKSFGYMAAIGFHELDTVYNQLGNVMDALVKQVGVLMGFDALPLELLSCDEIGHILILIPESTKQDVHIRLERLAKRIMHNEFILQNERVHVTPIIGYVELNGDTSASEQYDHILATLQYSENQLDLVPKFYSEQPKQDAVAKPAPTYWQQWLTQQGSATFQILLTFIIGWLIPLAIYFLLARLGFDITHFMYILVVIALLFTSALIWMEGFFALRNDNPPSVQGDYPPATVIIPAYLPNEAATILSTLDACFNLEYPTPVQIILAYNTPRPMPIEETLHKLEKEHSNFTAMCVEHSTSKAQNVNSALSYVTGEFTAIFDADHHPAPDSLNLAWAWLANGYDVVQGHCLIRNGDVSFVAQLVAVEFEAIYAVSHPGRARLHQFGIFGGSNGYWKTELLRETRMQGFMLTEDIDSSLRTIQVGFKIRSDRDIISRELAPTTWSSLWHQRMRWAQGWYQVSLRHTLSSFLTRELSIRQKLGMFQLLIWREIYPWIAMQIVPIVIFSMWTKGDFNWLVPIFVVTTIITLGTGPGQIFFILKRGHSSVTQRTRWMIEFMLFGIFYTEYKNLIGRVAQIKEIMGEHTWRTTPRA